MTPTITIRLDPDLLELLDEISADLGRSRSELVRDAVRRHLSLLRFEQRRRALLPFAEAAGVVSDEDVQKLVS